MVHFLTFSIAMLFHIPYATLLVAFINLISNHLQLFETPLWQRSATELQNITKLFKVKWFSLCLLFYFFLLLNFQECEPLDFFSLNIFV